MNDEALLLMILIEVGNRPWDREQRTGSGKGRWL